MSASLAAEGANTLIVEERTEAHLRATVPSTATIGGNPAFDFTTTPTLRLDIKQRRWDWTIGGAYTFTAADIAQPGAQQFTNFGSGTTGFSWNNRHVQMRLQEDGSYGQVNFSFLNPTSIAPQPGAMKAATNPSVNRITTRTVLYYSSQSSLSIIGQVDRRWTLSLSGGYLTSGGVNFQSRDISEGGLAGQRLAYFLGLATYRFDKRDDGILSLGGRHNETSVVADFGPLPAAGITFDPPPSAGVAAPIPLAFDGLTTDEGDAALTWRRNWSRHIDSQLEGGASLIRQRFPETPWRPVPTGEAVLSEKFGQSGITGVAQEGVYVIPTFDFISGALIVPFTATVTATVLEHKRTYSGQLGFTKTTSLFQSPQTATANGAPPVNPAANGESAALSATTPGYTAIQGNANITQALSKRFDVAAGVNVAWQETDPQPGQPQQQQAFVSMVVLVAFVYHERAIHF